MLILEIEKSIKGPQKHDSVRPVTTTACVTPAGFFFFSFFFSLPFIDGLDRLDNLRTVKSSYALWIT